MNTNIHQHISDLVCNFREALIKFQEDYPENMLNSISNIDEAAFELRYRSNSITFKLSYLDGYDEILDEYSEFRIYKDSLDSPASIYTALVAMNDKEIELSSVKQFADIANTILSTNNNELRKYLPPTMAKHIIKQLTPLTIED